MKVGGSRTSTIARSGLWPPTIRSSPAPSSACATTSTSCSRSSATMPFAQQRLILDDHDSHGSSARTRSLTRWRWDVEPAVERLDAAAQPGQPAAGRIGAPRPVVGDLDDEQGAAPG